MGKYTLYVSTESTQFHFMPSFDKQQISLEYLQELHDQEKAQIQNLEKSLQEKHRLVSLYREIIQDISRRKKQSFEDENKYRQPEREENETEIPKTNLVSSFRFHDFELDQGLAPQQQIEVTDSWGDKIRDSDPERALETIEKESNSSETSEPQSLPSSFPSHPDATVVQPITTDSNNIFVAEHTGQEQPLLHPVESHADSSNTSGQISPIQSTKISPHQMLRHRFQGMSQPEIAQQILEEANKEMRVVDITRLAYDCPTNEDFKRANDSMGVALRKGVGKHWNKVAGKAGCYICKQPSTQAGDNNKRVDKNTKILEAVSAIRNGKVDNRV